jgi:hypothetical protein
VRRARQEEEQADFSRGIMHARTSGDGDGIITLRRPSPNEHRLSEGNLSRIEQERYAEDLGRIIDAKELEEDNEELEEDDTDVEEDSDDEFDRELTKWEQRMELDMGHSSRMRRITESVQAEVQAERRGAASGPGRGANGGRGARPGGGRGRQGRGRQGQGTGGRGRGGRGGSRVELNNPVLVQTMKDAIVAKGVYSKYVNEIMHFVVWVCAEHAEWFMEYGKEKYDLLVILIENEKIQARQKRLKDGWMAMLRDAPNNAVFHVEQFTAARVMVYISRQANQTTGRALSREGYGTK